MKTRGFRNAVLKAFDFPLVARSAGTGDSPHASGGEMMRPLYACARVARPSRDFKNEDYTLFYLCTATKDVSLSDDRLVLRARA